MIPSVCPLPSQATADGRFTLGLGAGENLNEHVVGGGWPSADTRHEMLVEAVEIIRHLFEGGYVRHRGRHFEFDSAKLWDLPKQSPPIGIAVSGSQSAAIAGELADLVIAVEPKAELLASFAEAGGSSKSSYGQAPVSFDQDEKAARSRAYQQFRWFAGGWKVNAELPGTAGFAAASESITEDEVAEQIPCGSDVDLHLEAIAKFADAGFTHLALVQVGGEHQADFISWAAEELLPQARKL